MRRSVSSLPGSTCCASWSAFWCSSRSRPPQLERRSRSAPQFPGKQASMFDKCLFNLCSSFLCLDWGHKDKEFQPGLRVRALALSYHGRRRCRGRLSILPSPGDERTSVAGNHRRSRSSGSWSALQEKHLASHVCSSSKIICCALKINISIWVIVDTLRFQMTN